MLVTRCYARGAFCWWVLRRRVAALSPPWCTLLHPTASSLLLMPAPVVPRGFWAPGVGTASGDGSESPGMWGEAVDSTDGVSDLSLIRLSDAVAGRGLPLRLPRLVDIGLIKQEARGLR